jgi:hypothetical protein
MTLSESWRDMTAPLLAKHRITVVDVGASIVAEDGLGEGYLIRSFASTEERERQEIEFYTSDDWRQGPQKAVVACLESYHTIVIDPAPLAAHLR